jgi:hypothetical protein
MKAHDFNICNSVFKASSENAGAAADGDDGGVDVVVAALPCAFAARDPRAHPSRR